MRQKPEAQSYYQLDASPITFTLPEPGFLEGIKSKDRAILKMNKVSQAASAAAMMSMRHDRTMLMQPSLASKLYF